MTRQQLQLLPLKEAAQSLGVAVATLKRLMATGQISAVHVGAGRSRVHLRIDEAELRRFARDRSVSQAEVGSRRGRPPKVRPSSPENDFVKILEEKLAKKPTESNAVRASKATKRL